MSTALLEQETRASLGLLANNYSSVLGLQSSLSRSESNLSVVPKMLKRVIKDEAWRAFRLPDGRIVRNPADFRRFIEGPQPEGCQTPIHVLRHMVKGSDVADVVEELLRGTPGGCHIEGGHNREGVNQWINRNEITVDPDDSNPDILPLPEPSPRKRDYSRESKQGTSTGYTLRMLEKQAPEFLAKVKAGEMSPHGAAVRAGLRDKMIGVPAVPRKAARVLARHFSGNDLAELINLLMSALATETDG